jgi:peptide chain release factor 2
MEASLTRISERSASVNWRRKPGNQDSGTTARKRKNPDEPQETEKPFRTWEDLKRDYEETVELYDLAVSERDESLSVEIGSHLAALEERYARLRTQELLCEEVDEADAFLTIPSGAGGTESCDWVSMLLRMYLRWAENRSFSVETLDLLDAEGGIKSVTLQVSGQYAYGYLKGETGIHRLVGSRRSTRAEERHTSFASVYASPVVDDEIQIESGLRISGSYLSILRSGGTHVNKTDSAVRLTHLETGIVVACQNERSQHKNKATAMKILKSRLYEYYKEKQDEEREKNAAEKKEIAWGNQSVPMCFNPIHGQGPQDKARNREHPGGHGRNIDVFIEEYLKMNWKKKE